MNTLNKIKSVLAVALFIITNLAYAQQPELQYFRPSGQAGLNVFETPKQNDVEFTGVKVRLGGDFALQFQGLNQSNDIDSLPSIGKNFNLPTANLNLDVQLADGVRMHLRTYLSSRHHTEAYVKGGYLQIDKLDFVQEGFLEGIMQYTTIKVGMDEINYGDTHFRRSDNAGAIYNPFVGNYIMDAFTTYPYAEVNVQANGFVGVVGVTNGRLNQNVVDNTDKGYGLYGKLGYDKQINDDLRIRVTGSAYSTSDKGTREDLYAGDRAGARYYGVVNFTDDFRSGRFNPSYMRSTSGGGYINSFQLNPFVKFKGIEFFGVAEITENGNSDNGGGFTQLGAELIYRFGADENLYVGGRFNAVSGEEYEDAATKKIQRINVGGGWFLTKNVLTKVEYVNQQYSGAGWDGTTFQGAEFQGIVIEATIGF